MSRAALVEHKLRGLKMRLFLMIAFFLAGAVGMSVGASAVTVTGSYSGTITSVDSPLSGQFSTGQQFTFNFSYESTGGTDLTPANSNIGIYQGAVTSMSGNVGSYTYAGGGAFLDVFNDLPNGGVTQDMIALIGGAGGAAVGIWSMQQAAVELAGPDNLLSTKQPPSAFLAAALFPIEHVFTLSFRDFSQPTPTWAYVRGTIATTPIPATLPLLVSALGSLGFVGWRSRSGTRRMEGK